MFTCLICNKECKSQISLLSHAKIAHKLTPKDYYDKFNNKGVSISNEQLDICVRKVFNHEIGHALQHSFKGNDGMINNNYNIVVSNLVQKYPN